MPLFARLGHMRDAPLVKVGDWVALGQLLGYVGTSGASSGPHCHFDLFGLSYNDLKRLGGFTFYVYGWYRARVASVFHDPIPFIKDGRPAPWTSPKIGYGFLQEVKSGWQTYRHPGIDVNGINDYGAPIKSPVEGRVMYSQAPKDRVWKRWFGWVPWGRGWGNMIVIEVKPGFIP